MGVIKGVTKGSRRVIRQYFPTLGILILIVLLCFFISSHKLAESPRLSFEAFRSLPAARDGFDRLVGWYKTSVLNQPHSNFQERNSDSSTKTGALPHGNHEDGIISLQQSSSESITITGNLKDQAREHSNKSKVISNNQEGSSKSAISQENENKKVALLSQNLEGNTSVPSYQTQFIDITIESEGQTRKSSDKLSSSLNQTVLDIASGVNETMPSNPDEDVSKTEDNLERSTNVTPINHPDADAERTMISEARRGVARARLIVMTYNRHSALQRLLNSLASADYMEQVVDLDIWIDRAKDKHDVSPSVRAVSDAFRWKHGTKTVYARRKHGGLYAQWLETWNTTNALGTGEFALLLEDDLEVSPLFYVWLWKAREKYSSDPEVGAFTLQRLDLRNTVKNKEMGKIKMPLGTHAFKYRQLGSWGFAPKPEKWDQFLKWYADMKASGTKPYVEGLLTTHWYKGQESRGTMWTQWWVKFAYDFGYFTVLPWLDSGTTLCANWREPGIHFHGKSKGTDFPVFIGNKSEFQFPNKLLRLDWDGTIIDNQLAKTQ